MDSSLGMTSGFSKLSNWLRGGKIHERTDTAVLPSSEFPSVLKGSDSAKFMSVNEPRVKSSSRKVARKWWSREERKMEIDREHDMVIVSSNVGCLSGSESDHSDWSIGWMEPHASDFQSSNSDSENSFAVLVPCYGRGQFEKTGNLNNSVLGTGLLTSSRQNDFSSDVSENCLLVSEH